MKILALEVENDLNIPNEIQPFLKEEALTVWRLTQAGQVREVYFDAERHTAVIVLEASGTAEAEQILAQLPLVREGFIRFEIVPLVPYDGFARLFASTN